VIYPARELSLSSELTLPAYPLGLQTLAYYIFGETSFGFFYGKKLTAVFYSKTDLSSSLL
jgi:hypothetical protein